MKPTTLKPSKINFWVPKMGCLTSKRKLNSLILEVKPTLKESPQRVCKLLKEPVLYELNNYFVGPQVVSQRLITKNLENNYFPVFNLTGLYKDPTSMDYPLIGNICSKLLKKQKLLFGCYEKEKYILKTPDRILEDHLAKFLFLDPKEVGSLAKGALYTFLKRYNIYDIETLGSTYTKNK
jgi:hypothetical protein